MKRFALILMLAGAAFAAQAKSPASEPAPQAAEPEVTEVLGPADAAVAEAGAKPRDAHCLRETGTRIKRRDKNGCISAFGRSYTREELDRTGHGDLASALSTLDPAVRR